MLDRSVSITRKLGLCAGLAALSVVPAGCGSKQASLGEIDLTRYQESQAQRAAEREAFAKSMHQIEQVLEDYSKAFTNQGPDDTTTLSLERFLRRKVSHIEDLLIQSSLRDRSSLPEDLPEDTPEHLKRELEQNNWQRPVAVAALGFSESPDTFDPIMTALDDPTVRDRAVFALAVRADPRTPPERLAQLVEDREIPIGTRATAAFALYEVQRETVDSGPFMAVWRRILSAPIETYDGVILISALRGIGLTHDPAQADVVTPFAVHPAAQVRQAVCVSLGRLGNTKTHEVLLTLLDTTETNANVRLAARKALKELAGGEDRKYDIKQWRSVFELGG